MLTSLTTSTIGRPSHGTYTSTGLLRGGMGCRRELGQWGLLKWGSTESRDRHDRITQAIYPRIQGRVGPRGDQHVQAEFEREVQELRAETAYLKNAALIRCASDRSRSVGDGLPCVERLFIAPQHPRGHCDGNPVRGKTKDQRKLHSGNSSRAKNAAARRRISFSRSSTRIRFLASLSPAASFSLRPGRWPACPTGIRLSSADEVEVSC